MILKLVCLYQQTLMSSPRELQQQHHLADTLGGKTGYARQGERPGRRCRSNCTPSSTRRARSCARSRARARERERAAACT